MSDRRVYFGYWKSQADMENDFKEAVPNNAEVLFAAYDSGGYDGDAFVLFRQDGKLYEVHGSHCSCYGLEDQWEPEETTADELSSRKYILSSTHSTESVAAIDQLIADLQAGVAH